MLILRGFIRILIDNLCHILVTPGVDGEVLRKLREVCERNAVLNLNTVVVCGTPGDNVLYGVLLREAITSLYDFNLGFFAEAVNEADVLVLAIAVQFNTGCKVIIEVKGEIDITVTTPDVIVTTLAGSL